MWLATAGTDDAQMLKNCQPQSPESDYNGSDYLADDEMSACSSPSHSEVSDTEHEDHNQNTISMCRIYGWFVLCHIIFSSALCHFWQTLPRHQTTVTAIIVSCEIVKCLLLIFFVAF